ncbi:MAG: hypothetical protein V2J07_05400 [Anaerolineae bacterium]|nr:hypothetical protein [Anaerolineae bacterium]
MNRVVVVVLGVVLALLVVCCCVMVGAFIIFGAASMTLQPGDIEISGFNMPDIFEENVPFPESRFAPPSAAALEMVETLSSVHIPENNYADLSVRLEGIEDVPTTIPAKDYQIGDRENFWLSDSVTQENFQITAELKKATEHVFFWVEEGLSVSGNDLDTLVYTFEDHIYPTNRQFFGSEWNPGIDEDEQLYLVYARGLGGNVAGYFSAIDSFPPILQQFSNAHETFMINADVVNLNDDYLYSVLAHEFQHMIHWYQDRNETSWMNEGFSELAVSLNGYPVGGWHTVYLNDRDIQLNTWPVESSQQGVHYGSSYLFMQYFLDRFGAEVTQALVQEDLDGLASIDAVMKKMDLQSLNGNGLMSAEEIFLDWTVASTINDPNVDVGQFAFNDRNLVDGGGYDFSKTVLDCNGEGWTSMEVSQFGVEEFNLQCDTSAILNFQAVGKVGLLPTTPYSGEMAFWSNRNDESDMTLTREFDLSGVSGEITMTYQVWYEIEEDWDYAYVVASTDGKHWDMLQTTYGRTSDPHGSNYGIGYTGSTAGWVSDAVDLSDYAGKVVQVRFEYVTDPNLNANGLLVDDIRVDAIGYWADFEQDDGGWIPEGFVRVSDSLAQEMSVTLIKINGSETVVEIFDFTGGETESFSLGDFDQWDSVIVLVSGLTRYTTEPANFRLELVREE